MRKIILRLVILSIALFIYSCSKDSPTNTGGNGGAGSSYFPNGDSTYYKYTVNTTDTAGAEIEGTRTSRYNGTQPLEGTVYQVQYDTAVFQSQTTSSTAYFRKTDTGVFYFLDTTGLGASIPDSLEQYITTDSEVRALLFPLAAGSYWPVFKVTLHYGPITFAPVDVSASYAGTEDIPLNLVSGQITKSAIKIKYVLKLTFDFGAPSRNYEAYAWIVDGIGIVKWEGNATLLNGISGGGINFDDTTRVVSQSLIDYNVK
jgi:hypothetical protein